MTKTGKEIAGEKVTETISFFKQFLESLRDGNMFDFRISEVEYNGFVFDIVGSRSVNAVARLNAEYGTTPDRNAWKSMRSIDVPCVISSMNCTFAVHGSLHSLIICLMTLACFIFLTIRDP